MQIRSQISFRSNLAGFGNASILGILSDSLIILWAFLIIKNFWVSISNSLNFYNSKLGLRFPTCTAKSIWISNPVAILRFQFSKFTHKVLFLFTTKKINATLKSKVDLKRLCCKEKKLCWYFVCVRKENKKQRQV